METNQLKKAKILGSDLDLLSGFFFSSAFTRCFLYDLNENVIHLDPNDSFVKDRPKTLLQLLLIDIIQMIDFDLKQMNIGNAVQLRILDILHRLTIKELNMFEYDSNGRVISMIAKDKVVS